MAILYSNESVNILLCMEPVYEDDRILTGRIACGDKDSFRIIFDRYYDHIYGVAYAFTKSPELSEDIVQDIFLKVWLKREFLCTIEKFDAWLFIIARNHILNRLKQKVNEEQFCLEIHDYIKSLSDTPDQSLIMKQTSEALEKAVSLLPPQQQAVFRLSREDELNQEQIAESLKISVNTVKSHMNKALRFIRHYLNKYYFLFF